jgi:hypothetical protein
MTFAMTFAILAALTVSFAIGRIWQIRRDELARRHGFALPTIARIPLPKPKDAEISERDDPLDLAMVGVLTGKRTASSSER